MAAIEVVVAAGADLLADVCELAVPGEQVGLAAALGGGFDPDPAPVSNGGSDQLRLTRPGPGKLRQVGLAAGLRLGVSGR